MKVYWSTGGQILPPHDKAIIQKVMSVDQICTVDFDTAVADGRVKICTQEIDAQFLKQVMAFAWDGPRDVKLIFSPLHGVGAFACMPVLQQAGFVDTTVYQPHAQPSGDFPNVPGHVSNPENSQVFQAIIQYALECNADGIIATDPDCDRIGCALPVSLKLGSPWETLTGNQIGALLADYVCGQFQRLGKLTERSYLVTTLVTTQLTKRIAESYGVRCENNLHVGFKWIAGVMDDLGAEDFVFGTEESHGYLIGQYVRDKDGAAGTLLMAQLIAQLKSQGQTPHQRLDELFAEHGCHLESLVNVQMEGSEGMSLMKRLMEAFRNAPPTSLGGIRVAQVRDYKSLTTRLADGSVVPLIAPPADMVMLDLELEGNYFAVRPSGTEPKVKFFMFGYCSPADCADLTQAKKLVAERLAALEVDIRAYVAKVTS